MSAARPSGIDLVAAATEDFRANLRHPRAQALLIDYYVKQGMTSEELRQAMRAAAAPRHAPIRVQIPDTVAA
ncbi:MAG TPA: hypothetical protein VFX49_02340 [Chloroflexota bacterium]|nr:hypothetical protein [Chloroflexota bacterium]